MCTQQLRGLRRRINSSPAVSVSRPSRSSPLCWRALSGPSPKDGWYHPPNTSRPGASRLLSVVQSNRSVPCTTTEDFLLPSRTQRPYLSVYYFILLLLSWIFLHRLLSSCLCMDHLWYCRSRKRSCTSALLISQSCGSNSWHWSFTLQDFLWEAVSTFLPIFFSGCVLCRAPSFLRAWLQLLFIEPLTFHSRLKTKTWKLNAMPSSGWDPGPLVKSKKGLQITLVHQSVLTPRFW